MARQQARCRPRRWPPVAASDLRMTRTPGPVVPAPPAPGEASGTVAAASFTAMRKVVEFKEMGMGALASTCGLGMALKAMADSEKNPILIDGALSLCNLLVAALVTRATPVLPRRCERV